jgi:hypothetical protein
MCECGERLDLPAHPGAGAKATCAACGKRYVGGPDGVRRAD